MSINLALSYDKLSRLCLAVEDPTYLIFRRQQYIDDIYHIKVPKIVMPRFSVPDKSVKFLAHR